MRENKNRDSWLICYHGRDYIIRKINDVYIIGIYDGDQTRHKETKDAKLKHLIQMWIDTQFDSLPGKFITKITGNDCVDFETTNERKW